MRYCLLFLSALLMITSCEKVETPKSKADMLRDGKWWISERITVTFYPTHVQTTVVKDQTPECKWDDRVIFRKGSKGGYTTGEEKCGAELDEYEFTWGLRENDTKIYMYGVSSFMNVNDVNATVEDISNDRLVIRYQTYEYAEDDKFRTDTTETVVTFRK